jgi:hypothetical protein
VGSCHVAAGPQSLGTEVRSGGWCLGSETAEGGWRWMMVIWGLTRWRGGAEQSEGMVRDRVVLMTPLAS